MSLRSAFRLLRRLARGVMVIVVLLLLEAAGGAPFPQSHSLLGFLVIGAALLVPWAFPERAAAGAGLAFEEREQPPPRRRVLLVGAGEVGNALARDLEEHFPTDYDIVGFVEDDPGARTENGWEILGRSEEIAELVRRHEVDEVLVASGLPLLDGEGEAARGATGRRPSPDRLACLDTHSLRTLVSSLTLGAGRPNRYAVWKRLFDVVFSLAALIAAAPAVALAALAIRLTSPGQVLYSQERIGRGGRRFTIYKLRTMICGAEDETGPVLAQPRDPRITRIGRVLRATKLDEVPQFFNVLRGDMSVIGPRPERPCFVEEYCCHIPAYPERHRVRPGISGLAQVNGGYRTHVYVKLRYDLIYVSRQSFWLDLQIMARTLRAVARNLNGEY